MWSWTQMLPFVIVLLLPLKNKMPLILTKIDFNIPSIHYINYVVEISILKMRSLSYVAKDINYLLHLNFEKS